MGRPADLSTSVATDPVAAALRTRRRRGLAVVFALLLLAGTAVVSHVLARTDSADWDGKAVTVDQVLPDGTLLIARPGAGPLKVGWRAVDLNESEAACRYLTARLTGKTVTLKVDGLDPSDANGRLLVYVYLGDSDCLNVDLVRDGMASFDRRSKSFLQSTLDQVETAARTRNIGLWKDSRFTRMPQWRQDWVNARKAKK